ncbi:MAG: hypothetical protein STSR0009_26620 [Methanoregula sp.]
MSVIDIATNSIGTTLNVGRNPTGIAIDSSTNKVYVANQMDKTITIIGQIPATPIPVANFTAIPISGTAPLTVQFNDLSTNSPTTWNWSFGDGSSSTLQNPSHTYTSAGTFNVTLNATNSAGSNTFVRTNYITVSSSETYVFITKWGSGGPGDGQFNGPWGVSVDPPGNVYISDNSNYRIQKFSSNGTFITKWGSKGSGDGQSYGFSGIAVDPSGNVYVTDPENNRIQKFSSTGTFLTKWGYYGNNYGAFYNPRSVAVDPSGNVYVVDTWNHRIQKFNSSGTFLATWGSSGFDNGQFYHPYGVAVDSSGDVYVADRSNHRIQKFSSTGTFLTKWGSEGSGDGQFSHPYGVAVDSSSNIYVADTENHRIQKFSSTGKFIAKWGSSGSDNGQFDYPISVAADTSGNVYVSDSNNNRIQKFALSSANPPVANFYGSPTTGSAPLTVAFYDQSTNTPRSWSWSFGDGSTSTLQNPSHTYTSAEAYTVVLTATNSAGSNTKTIPTYISVTSPTPNTLAFQPRSATVSLGSTTTYSIVLDNASQGLSGYNITIASSNTSIAEIVGVTYPAWASMPKNSTLPADRAWFKAVDLTGDSGTGEITFCTVTMRGDSRGITTLIITPEKVEDRASGRYTPSVVSATLTVTSPVKPFPKPGGGFFPDPTDPTQDGKYEDLDGNGWIGFNDVVVYYQNMEAIDTGTYGPVAYYDYDNSGFAGFNDVVKLNDMV